MTTIKVTIEGIEAAKVALNNLASSIENPGEKLMSRVGDAMLEDVDQRFATRGYGTWPANAPSTIRRKGHGNVLVESGAMRASTKISIQGNEAALTVPHGGRNGSPAVPGYHQRGTGRMPQRQIVDVTPQLMLLLSEALSQWISDVVAAFGKEL